MEKPLAILRASLSLLGISPHAPLAVPHATCHLPHVAWHLRQENQQCLTGALERKWYIPGQSEAPLQLQDCWKYPS